MVLLGRQIWDWRALRQWTSSERTAVAFVTLGGSVRLYSTRARSVLVTVWSSALCVCVVDVAHLVRPGVIV